MRTLIGFVGLALAVGCGGAGEVASNPPPSSAAPPPTAAASASAAAPVVASAVEPTAPPPPATPTSPAPPPPVRWTKFPGPHVAPPPAETVVWHAGLYDSAKAWGDSTHLFSARITRVEGNDAIFVGRDKKEIFVPGALIAPAATKEPKTGDVVLWVDKPGIDRTADYGVVSGRVAVNGEPRFLVEVDSEIRPQVEVTASNLRVLSGELAFGEFVAYQAHGNWTVGTYVAPAEKDAWVLGVGRVVRRQGVRALKTKVHKQGAKVLVTGSTVSSFLGADFNKSDYYQTLVPGTVTEVLRGGSAYRVRFGKGEDGKPLADEAATYSIDDVFAPFPKK